MIVCSKPASVPSSPVEGKNQIMRTASNPFFVPMRKEPPNYDDAVKNLANKVLCEEMSRKPDCLENIWFSVTVLMKTFVNLLIV